ncbi:histidine phosphatase family protein [Pseudonocardia sp. TRM90224]|uniref:histidine phosphatase family protein n=1 Tax=Pseudonocardia sp. TRM90224 TaxID=2812678 RepID=UPI001E364875|nr:histidine phosphatase family protein [Pseudonocardia sp. TRM90224]
MSARLTLVTHASTRATAAAAFAQDEPLEPRGTARAAAARAAVPRHDRAVCGPATGCRETAEALGLAATVDAGLRDWDLGRWAGRTLDEVVAAEPDAVQEWLTVPDAAPHGGEPLTALLERVAGWLDGVPGDGHTVAVTHAAVVRAAVLAVVSGAPHGFWRIDVAPLTATSLGGGPGRWTVRTTGTAM